MGSRIRRHISRASVSSLRKLCSRLAESTKADEELMRGLCTMRFGTTARVLAKCKLKYYTFSRAMGSGVHVRQ